MYLDSKIEDFSYSLSCSKASERFIIKIYHSEDVINIQMQDACDKRKHNHEKEASTFLGTPPVYTELPVFVLKNTSSELTLRLLSIFEALLLIFQIKSCKLLFWTRSWWIFENLM